MFRIILGIEKTPPSPMLGPIPYFFLQTYPWCSLKVLSPMSPPSRRKAEPSLVFSFCSLHPAVSLLFTDGITPAGIQSFRCPVPCLECLQGAHWTDWESFFWLRECLGCRWDTIWALRPAQPWGWHLPSRFSTFLLHTWKIAKIHIISCQSVSRTLI